MSDQDLSGGTRGVRLLNRTDRPWLLVVIERRRPDAAGRVLGTVAAPPFRASGRLGFSVAPGAAVYAALLSDMVLDSIVVSAVVTTPQRLPERSDLVLEALQADGALRLGLTAGEPLAPGRTPRRTTDPQPPGAASAAGTRKPLDTRR